VPSIQSVDWSSTPLTSWRAFAIVTFAGLGGGGAAVKFDRAWM
jgi:hypothetical protein